MMSSSLYCQVAVQVSSCSAKGTNWSVFDRYFVLWPGIPFQSIPAFVLPPVEPLCGVITENQLHHGNRCRAVV